MTRPYAIHYMSWHNSQTAKTACGLVARMLPPSTDPQLATDPDQVTCKNCRAKKSFIMADRARNVMLYRAITGEPVKPPKTLPGWLGLHGQGISKGP